MILTSIHHDRLPAVLDLFAGGLDDMVARAVFQRIARPGDAERAAAAQAAIHHGDALVVLADLGMAVRLGAPCEDFSWDGRAARNGTEAYVLLHEAAHFQLATPERRCRIDFGLGPGPETGRRDEAARHAMLFGVAREREEAMASLLGILWEVDLGQPALASFLDQNWLEGAAHPRAVTHFQHTLNALCIGGFVNADGQPTYQVRQTSDASAY